MSSPHAPRHDCARQFLTLPRGHVSAVVCLRPLLSPGADELPADEVQAYLAHLYHGQLSRSTRLVRIRHLSTANHARATALARACCWCSHPHCRPRPRVVRAAMLRIREVSTSIAAPSVLWLPAAR
jgi:hypothetical protein